MLRCVVACWFMTAVVVRRALFVVCCLGVVVWSVLLSGSAYCLLLFVFLVRCGLFVDYWLVVVVCDCVLSAVSWYCVLVDVCRSLLCSVCVAGCCVLLVVRWVV